MSPEQLLKTIRARRQLLKVTQADLAELSGVSLRTVKSIEEGTANPTVEIIAKILDILGLSLAVAERVSHE
jgi:transcriptional regulator with XRE-family HTH domain